MLWLRVVAEASAKTIMTLVLTAPMPPLVYDMIFSKAQVFFQFCAGGGGAEGSITLYKDKNVSRFIMKFRANEKILSVQGKLSRIAFIVKFREVWFLK